MKEYFNKIKQRIEKLSFYNDDIALLVKTCKELIQIAKKENPDPRTNSCLKYLNLTYENHIKKFEVLDPESTVKNGKDEFIDAKKHLIYDMFHPCFWTSEL